MHSEHTPVHSQDTGLRFERALLAVSGVSGFKRTVRAGKEQLASSMEQGHP